jgi:hypothetical protein
MSTIIEERVATLEKELNDLQQLIQGTRIEKDWRKTFGLSANEPRFDEMIRLNVSSGALSFSPRGICCRGTPLPQTPCKIFVVNVFGSARWT